MITYKPLWETLKKKNISTYKLLKEYGISRGMLDNLKHDRSITMTTMKFAGHHDKNTTTKYYLFSMKLKKDNHDKISNALSSNNCPFLSQPQVNH